MSLCLTGCASQGINGAGIGGALGSITGQIIGHNTESTLIGAGVGTILGYMTGNEVDKFNQNNVVVPRQRYSQQQYRQPQQQYVPQQQYRRAPQRQQNWQEGW